MGAARLSRALAAGLLAVTAAGSTIDAGSALFAQPPVSTTDADIAPGTPLFRPSDALFGAVIIGSFLAIDPLEGFEERASATLSRDISERNTVLRQTGRALGDLRVDLGLTAGTYLIGRLIGSRETARIGLHTLEAMLAAEAVTQGLKFGLGRARPSVSPGDSDEFLPFRLRRDFNSFPSGHTAKIFAIAATLSDHLSDDEPWVPFVVYPVATWTASTRVLDRRHWLTDVVGGAALGILSARLVERANHDSIGHGPSWFVGPGPAGGLSLVFRAPLP